MLILGMILCFLIGFAFWKLLELLNKDNYYGECIMNELINCGYSDDLYEFALEQEGIRHE